MIAPKQAVFIALLMPVAAKSQHVTKHYDILWASYNNTIQLGNKWGLVNDAQVRTVNWADKWLLYAFRSGASYRINKDLAVAAGVALFRSAQYTDKRLFFKNEWRSWEEVSYNLRIQNKINFFERMRTEQRFFQLLKNNVRTDSYQFVFRLRYRFEWLFGINEKIKFLAGNEVFVNPGYLNNTFFFDQNRTFAGLNFKLNSNTTLQSQYIKIFQWRSNTSVLEDQNAIRVNFVQQFNLRKNKPKKI